MQIFVADAAWWLIAQGEGGGGGVGDGGNMTTMMIMFGTIVLLFYFIMVAPQRREQKRMREMLDGLKKNDRVVTAGGIWGVVVNVQKEFVTIKIDESSNAKLKVVRSSISRVLGDADEAEKSDKEKS